MQDVVIAGNLTLNGTTTTIDSQVVNLNDNVVVVNADPSAGDYDSGLMSQRHHSDFQNSSGEALAASVSGATAGGASSNTITLADASHASVGSIIVITGGTGSLQQRSVISISGTTATVDYEWTTEPDNTSVYSVYNGVANRYTGLVHDHSQDRWVLGH